MKFRAQPKPPKQADLKAIAPSLLSDPAFSADPHSHPYFVTSHEPAWASSPPPGHPILKNKNRRPLANFATDDSTITDSEYHLIQPQNSPVSPKSVPNDPSSFACPPDILPQAPALESKEPPNSTASSPHTRAATSAVSTAPDSSPPPLVPVKQERKKNLMSFFTRRKSSRPGEPAGSVAVLKPKKPQTHRNDPSTVANDVTQLPRPTAPHQASEPVIPHNFDRPALPARSATTGTATPMSISTATSIGVSSASRRLAEGVSDRIQDLDRIDELDETNPWGVALHHGGPYEAAIQAMKRGEKRIPLGFVNNNSAHDYHKRAMEAHGNIYVPPQAPTGVSLNLSPGQILPRNFHLHLDNAPRRRGFAPAPQPQMKPSVIQAEPLYLNSRRHSLAYPPVPKLPDPHPRPREEPHEHISRQETQKPVRDDPSPSFHIGMAMLQGDAPESLIPRVFVDSGIPEEEKDFDPYDPIHLELEHSRTPSPAVYPPPEQSRGPSPDAQGPKLEADTSLKMPEKLDLHMQTSASQHGTLDTPPHTTPATEEDHRLHQPLHTPVQSQTSSRNPSPGPARSRKSDDIASSDNTNHSRSGSAPASNRPMPEPPLMPHRRNIPQNLSPAAPMYFPERSRQHIQQQPPPPPPPSNYENERDGRSTQQTISTFSSGQTRGSKPPPHRHVPRRLVMPAPLNSSLAPTPNHIQQPPSTAHLAHKQAPVQFRPQPQIYPIQTLSPPRPAPPVQNSIRAQNISITASRKLRKRNSMISPSQTTPPSAPIVATVSFAPPIIGFDHSISGEKILARSKTEKVSKRVLSKRRTNL